MHDVPSLLAAIHEAHHVGGPRHIVLSAGEYRLSQPIVLDEGLSGREGAPFELTAALGAKVVLAGSVDLQSLHWRRWRDGIWRAKAGHTPFQRLWLGEQPLIRARYPNYDPGKSIFGGGAADALAPARVAGWRNPAGGVLYAIHGRRWGGFAQAILGKTPDGGLILGPVVGNNRAAPADPNDRYVENILEELDAPGEWYHNAKSGWLYLKPTDGARPPAAAFHAGAAEELLRIEGRVAMVHDVAVRHIIFEQTEPTLLKAAEPLLRSDWKFYRSGAVTIENAKRVAIADSDFHDLGGNALVVSGRASHVVLSDNLISSIGGTAIAFVGRSDAVRSPLFEYHQSQPLESIDRTPGPKTGDYPADSAARDNLIHDIGLLDKQAAGVEISMAARITVEHNSIYRVPRAGINIGDGAWGGHQILGNDVFETVTQTGDHGAFNSWGRDRYWDPNRAEMNRRVGAEPSLVLLDAAAPTVLRHNRFRCDHGWDIDFDDGSSNYIVEDNVLLSGGLKFREGFRRVARNNIIIDNTFHPHVWFADSHDVFEHNIVMRDYQPIGMTAWGDRIDSNLFPDRADLAAAQARGTDRNSAAGSPDFIDAADGDYRVKLGSPALALGFRNFATDDFGVRTPRLRALAERPAFPVLREPTGPALAGARERVLGLTLKSVETLGEQSVAGLASQRGALVLAIEKDSPADLAGFRVGDAVIQLQDTPITGPVAVIDAPSFAQAMRFGKGSVRVTIMRDQRQFILTLNTK